MCGQFGWSRKSVIGIDSEWGVIGSVDPALQRNLAGRRS